MDRIKAKRFKRHRRHLRVRKKVFGTPDKPRLAIYRSLKHIYAQLIDDTKGVTLLAASSLTKDIKDGIKGKKKTEQAMLVGEYLGKKAVEKGIKEVVFDRGGFLYHGRVKALADGVRKAGLKF